MTDKSFSYYLTKYFTDFLPNQKNASVNTVKSYRDTFVLLLRFYKDTYHIQPEKLSYESFANVKIEAFLDWLENNRNTSVRTRNQRLAAIHAFFRYVQYRDPAGFEQAAQVLTVPYKKAPVTTVAYMSLDEVSYLFSLPDRHDKKQFRDLMIMVLLYESGARVQELIDLTPLHLHFGKTTTLELHGKGNKTRLVPINMDVSSMLKKYIQLYDKKTAIPLFTNRNGNKLTRAGVQYIIDKYTVMGREKKPEMFQQHITNHSFRHSRAMHLLETGVNLVYIRDFLGHTSVMTTEIYAKTNPKIKEEHLKRNSLSIKADEKYTDNDKEDLIDWLKKNL